MEDCLCHNTGPGFQSPKRSSPSMSPKNRCLNLFALLALPLFLSSNVYAQDAPSRYEIGGEFVNVRFHAFGLTDNRIGFGTRFTYNFNALFALDTEWSLTPTDHEFFPQSDFIGDRTNQFFAGVKVGGRKSRFGMFAKLRPGFIRTENFLQVIDDGVVPPCPPCADQSRVGPRTDFLLDAGAVIEVVSSQTLDLALRLQRHDHLLRGRGNYS